MKGLHDEVVLKAFCSLPHVFKSAGDRKKKRSTVFLCFPAAKIENSLCYHHARSREWKKVSWTKAKATIPDRLHQNGVWMPE